MKIAYAGFDLFYKALEELHLNGCEIAKIFTCKVDNISEFNTQIITFAQINNIPFTTDKITVDDLNALKAEGVEALFCAGYYYLIPIIDDFKMVNIHPSLLPLGRGPWPMPVAILNKHKTSGVTFHKMDSSFDTGDIIMQKSFELSQNENLNSFMDKIYALLPDMIKTLVSDFSYYYDNATVQGDGEYWQEPNMHDYVITKDTDFDKAQLILNAFMGFNVLYNDGEKIHQLLNKKAFLGNNANKQYKIKDGYIE